MTTVAVLGAGSWGTALAKLLADAGRETRLWAYEADVVRQVNERHENESFLAGVSLPPGLTAHADASEAVTGADVILSVSPSQTVRSVLRPLAGVVGPGTLVVTASKGIELESLDLMHEVIAACLPGRPIAVLSGPSFAREVAEGQPTAVVAASGDAAAAERTQELFATPRFRVYTQHDVVGVELCGALKNVIAIAAGILEGLGLGHNPRAALITRGLAEIMRLGRELGADPLTFAGLAGMGDLVLTTTGGLSRNRSLGLAIGKGATLAEHLATHRTVAEGADTATAAVRLGKRHGVELPICEQVDLILHQNKRPDEAIADLMERDLKPEQWR